MSRGDREREPSLVALRSKLPFAAPGLNARSSRVVELSSRAAALRGGASPETDEALVAALRAGRTDASTVLFDRYGGDVERVLYRILGPDSEIKDLLQDVFVVALGSLDKLRDPDALRGWLTSIAVHKARKCILKRQRWRFIQLWPGSELPEREAPAAPPEVSEALRCTYAVLARMPADERVPFALRYVAGMELTAVAAACDVSLATIKRRLGRAQATFGALASQQPALREWLEPATPANDGGAA
jgi:RNA polymerase sigma-70 factor (ECF subfamily)